MTLESVVTWTSGHPDAIGDNRLGGFAGPQPAPLLLGQGTPDADEV
jgi:hypothetical protein